MACAADQVRSSALIKALKRLETRMEESARTASLLSKSSKKACCRTSIWITEITKISRARCSHHSPVHPRCLHRFTLQATSFWALPRSSRDFITRFWAILRLSQDLYCLGRTCKTWWTTSTTSRTPWTRWAFQALQALPSSTNSHTVPWCSHHTRKTCWTLPLPNWTSALSLSALLAEVVSWS